MKEYIEREALIKYADKWLFRYCKYDFPVAEGIIRAFRDSVINHLPAADVVEVDRLGKVGRLMLPNKGCPRGPIGRLGMAGGKTQDKKAILIEELCCMDTFEDVDGNVWRPVQEEVLQEVIEILRKEE